MRSRLPLVLAALVSCSSAPVVVTEEPTVDVALPDAAPTLIAPDVTAPRTADARDTAVVAVAQDAGTWFPMPDGYPRPQLVREQWLSLDGAWELSSAAALDTPPFGKTLDKTVQVPFPIESTASGIAYAQTLAKPMMNMWYRKTISVPTAWAGERVLLNFGAVDWQSSVYVNGNKIGVHAGGYDAFSYDITDSLGSGSQEILVGVYDPTEFGEQPVGKQKIDKGGIFHTPASGIWQTVWIEPAPAAHITAIEPTTDVATSTVQITVRAAGATTETVRAVVMDGSQIVGTATGAVGTALSVPIASPKLWSPDAPFLYDLLVTLERSGAPVDRATSYVGMRAITLGDAGGFLRPLLNGTFVFHMGVLDHGYWPDGVYTAPSDDALRADVEKTKALGFNVMRKHVKVEPARFYYWADKLGLLVWQDMPSIPNWKTPSEAGKKQYEAELGAMIDQHKFFPSIAMWIVFNEGWGQYDTVRVTNWAKSLDPTRLVSDASGWTDEGAGDVIDYHAYPGPWSPDPTATRIAVNGEYGAYGGSSITQSYLDGIASVKDLMLNVGLGGVAYTMLADTEGERSGLISYDRATTKVDTAKLAAAHADLIAAARR
jgi:beta-galactosidase/beta-glucuronidase